MVDLHAVPARTWHSKTDGVPLLPSVGRLVGGVLSNVGRLISVKFFLFWFRDPETKSSRLQKENVSAEKQKPSDCWAV